MQYLNAGSSTGVVYFSNPVGDVGGCVVTCSKGTEVVTVVSVETFTFFTKVTISLSSIVRGWLGDGEILTFSYRGVSEDVKKVVSNRFIEY